MRYFFLKGKIDMKRIIFKKSRGGQKDGEGKV